MHACKGTSAPRARLTPCPRPRSGFWQDPSNVEAELRRWMREHGVSGRMPTEAELRSSNANTLHFSIGRLGGSTAFAQRLRLAPALQSSAGDGERRGDRAWSPN